MSDTEGQPDPDIRTEPLEGTEHLERTESSEATETSAGTPVSPGHPGSDLRDLDEVEKADRPRPDKDPETQEDTASGGRAE